jgi:drug/metabolite transporter (DMT)-like permease
MRRTRERNFKNYFAGAALSFSVVLIVTQMVALYFDGLSAEEAVSLDYVRSNLLFAVNFLGGALGSFLVARKVGDDYIQVGTVTAICSYILETVFFFFFGEEPSSDIWVIMSLVSGGIIGSLFAKAQNEKRRLAESKAGKVVQMPGESRGVEG